MIEVRKEGPSVARCAPRGMQHATIEAIDATGRATATQHTGLKGLAMLALSRNGACNAAATMAEKPRNDGATANDSNATPVATAIANMRDRLMTLAKREAIDAEVVHALPESELAATVEQIATCEPTGRDNVLRGYLRGLRDSDLRRRGKVPRDETAAALCRHCGPVWVAPEVADAAPKVNGWAVMLGCPWCHVRKDGSLAIPRPLVTCSTCTHYAPDTINPAAGAGHCRAGVEGLAYPNARRYCATFSPAGTK